MRKIILFLLIPIITFGQSTQTTTILNIGGAGFVTIDHEQYPRGHVYSYYSITRTGDTTLQITGLGVNAGGKKCDKYLNGDNSNTPFASGLDLLNWMNSNFEAKPDTIVTGGGGSGNVDSIIAGSGINIASAAGVYTVTSTSSGGSVTQVTSNNLSPLFTTTVTNSTSTPAISYSLTAVAPNKFFGGATSGTVTPTYRVLDLLDLPYTGNTLALGTKSVTAANLSGVNTGDQDLSVKMNALNPTDLKTSAYTALPNDLVTVNTTSGGVTITLTATPTDKTLIAIKHIIQGGTNVVTVTCGGSDVFNKTAGTTSFTMPYVNQAYIFQYQSSTGIWYIIADDLPKAALDAIYTSTVIGTPNISVIGSPSAGFTVSLVASPSLQGNPTATTQSLGDNSTKLATTGYVDGTKVAYSTTNSPTFTGTVTVNGVSVFSSVATFNSTINKLTLTAPANGSTITIIDGKTFTCANTIKFTATDGQSYALPTTSATIARTDAGQTFTGTQTFSSASNYSWANATETSLAVSTAGVVSQASWVDFSGTAAITSYSVITTSSYQYQKIGKEVKLHVIVQGQRTNSAGTITFTLPFAASTATRAHYYALWGTSTNSSNQLYRLTIPGDGTTTATIQAASTTSAVINFLSSNLQDIDINISYWTD